MIPNFCFTSPALEILHLMICRVQPGFFNGGGGEGVKLCQTEGTHQNLMSTSMPCLYVYPSHGIILA